MFLILVLILLPVPARALQYNGVLSIENYYSTDSASRYDFDFLTTRLRFDATGFDEGDQLSFHFSGRERLRFSSSDYNEAIRNERIDRLNLEYDRLGGRVDIVAGRFNPKEFGSERVDGLNLLVHMGKGGLGLFGGLRPDPFKEMFTADYQIEGGYFFYRTPALTTNLGFTRQDYKGRLDRQYFSGQIIANPVGTLRLFASATADLVPKSSEIRLSNLLTEVSYHAFDRVRLSAGFTQFRSVEFFSSMDFEINTTRQESYYARTDIQVLKNSGIFGKFERRTLDYPSIQTERLNSDTVQAGIRAANFLFADIQMTATAAFTDSFDSKYRTYNLDLSRLNWRTLDVSVGGSYSENHYDLADTTDTLWTYYGSLSLYLKKSWTASLYYERIEAKTYHTDIGMIRVSYRFKSAKKAASPSP